MEWLDLSIAEIHAALVEGKTTPLALTELALQRAKQDNNNAFETIIEEEALAFAKTLTTPEVDNPFWGVPFVLKDNFSTKGILTTASSNILADYVPVFDATVVRKLKEAKAILIGKTTLDELAMGGTGTTGHLGTTFNPYDPSHQHLIGGSSCGSAAAVSAGIVPFSLGSDTGDSVRKPASYAGLVGLKPTWGRISRYGLFPFAPSLDHVGTFSRTVEDAALLLNLLAGHDHHDATSSLQPKEDYTRLLHQPLKGLKIAVIQEIIDVIRDEEIKKGFVTSLSWLNEAGAEINYVSLPVPLLESILPTYMVISCAEATSNNANLDGIKFGPRYGGQTYEEVMMQARTHGFSELIKRRFVIGSFALMRENQDVLFLRAQKNRRQIVEAVQGILANYDAIYLPAAPTTAPHLHESGDRLSSLYLIADNHLALGNFAGLPSITVPLAMSKGLPYGGNLTCQAFDEAKMFQIAAAIENASGMKNAIAGRVKA